MHQAYLSVSCNRTKMSKFVSLIKVIRFIVWNKALDQSEHSISVEP